MGSNLNNKQDTLETVEKEINPKVDLNNLMRRVKDDEKKSKRQKFSYFCCSVIRSCGFWNNFNFVNIKIIYLFKAL